MSSPIVVAIDGSDPANAALDWAADDAARRGRDLRIVNVLPPWAAEQPIDTADDDATLAERRELMLTAAADRARWRHPSLDVTTAHLTGAVIERLRTESESADTLVVGSRGLGGFAGLVLGSVGLALAGHARGPVVIVRSAVRRPL
ncbi:universal stress protein, partial [Nonomuraea lactucae]|uniref:universal stress protein n=1 Tax=Nonomuraea lactucae TaxID=2249762 RepID=UPI0013B435F0